MVPTEAEENKDEEEGFTNGKLTPASSSSTKTIAPVFQVASSSDDDGDDSNSSSSTDKPKGHREMIPPTERFQGLFGQDLNLARVHHPLLPRAIERLPG